MDTAAPHTGLLADLSPAARERLSARARHRPFAAGEVIVRQDEPGDEMFVIRSGSCRVTLGDASLGLVREVGTLGPGDCFGEVALLAGSPRTATVTAVEPGELLAAALRSAVQHGASDLHVEPGDEGGRIRARLDGHLVPVEQGIDRRLFDRIVSRLKVMAEVDIAERRRPQDGRFTLVVGDQRVEARLSTMPCLMGEKIVLRLLDHGKGRRRLHDLVLSGPLCDRLEEVFASPGGLILVTGPTGAGKTTPLYAGLEEIWRLDPLVNIVTLEDPVEYRLPYAVQVQIDRAVDMTFAHGLRALLRQDPDVILVGEMRDPESANIAVEAATTGHLVLSSLHTESAVDTITRLRRLEVPPYLIAATLRCVVSQRLVPRVCRACARPAADSAVIDRLLELGVIAAGDSEHLVEGAGCDTCRGKGEVGRAGVYEVLLVDAALRPLIERSAPAAEIAARLTSENFVSTARYCRYALRGGDG